MRIKTTEYINIRRWQQSYKKRCHRLDEETKCYDWEVIHMLITQVKVDAVANNQAKK